MAAAYPQITHVIFDMDGLLLNTEPRYEQGISSVCRKYGTEYTLDAKREAMGRTARGAAEVVTAICNLPVTPEQFLDEMEDVYKSIFAERVELLPGAEKLVKHLKAHNIPICIATSSKESTFKMKSKHHPEFFRLFHHVVKGSDDPQVEKGKPEPDIFLVAASRFEPPPDNMKNVKVLTAEGKTTGKTQVEFYVWDGKRKQMRSQLGANVKMALVFEDSPNGVKAAEAAGMQCVWVPDECTDTSGARATLILDSLEQFNPALFGLPPYKD